MTARVGWLDCSSGVSGDMLLGALHAVGALADLPELLASLRDLDVACAAEPVTRHGLAATAFRVTAGAPQPERGLAEVQAIVERSAAPEPVRRRAAAVFERLAAAEAAAHGIAADQVHFHEVGAVDSLVDVLGVSLGLHALSLDRLVVSPIALGGGRVATAHGELPVPAPATLGVLAGCRLASYGGPVDVELATPTGIALLAEWASESGRMPELAVTQVGVGAGSRDLPGHANVVRLVLGTAQRSAECWSVIEANVDDLDPRLWPVVLDRLLAAGAADAWLTPILMKKGRPAHTVSALVTAATAEAARRVLVAETSTIGVRSTAVAKHPLDRSWLTVDVAGHEVRVKLAHDGGRRTNVAPEFDDVAAAAASTGLPAKEVLARAAAAAHEALARADADPTG